MTSILSTAALAFALITVLLRLLTPRGRAGAVPAIADLSLFVAAACVLVGIARPEGWLTGLLHAPGMNAPSQPVDPRLPSHLALLVAALASLPAAFSSARDVRPVPALLPGALFAALGAALLAFVGMHDPLALLAAAVGSFAAGTALGACVRSLGAPGSGRGRALLVGACAVLGVAATLTLYGLRLDPVEVKQDEAASANGIALSYRGLADSSANPRVLSVEVQQGMKLREMLPTLAVGDSSATPGRPAAEMFTGPVVAALGWRQENESAHPLAWLARGDSITAKDAVITFADFRSEKGDPVKFYADLDVRRGGEVTRVSPGIAASATGSQPFAAQIPGVGPVAVARIDADKGRVALMVSGLQVPPGPSFATLRMQMRPGLEVAWGALVVAAVALLLALAGAGADAKRA